MALFDNILNGGNVMSGLVIGAGALIAWPLISPIARPLAKSVIEGGLMAYRQAEEFLPARSKGSVILLRNPNR